MTTELSAAHIAFIGAGSMAEAIIRGLVETDKVPARQISAVNRSNQHMLDELQAKYGIHTASMTGNSQGASQFIAQADVVIIAMKPKDAASGLAAIRHLLSERQLLISVLAGTSIATLHALLGKPLPVIRTMPNTSSSIGLGVTGMCCSVQVNEFQRQIGFAIFEAVGQVCTVEEQRMDIVTGLSGSGPAYVYYFIEALIQGGMAGGLTREAASQLAVQTVIGAAEMVRVTGEEPAELRRKVTSPNGSTQAALEVLDRRQFTDTVASAVLRSAERAREMGEQLTREVLGSDVVE